MKFKNINLLRCKACRFKKCLSVGMSIENIKMGRSSRVEKDIVTNFTNFSLINHNPSSEIIEYKNDEKSINCSTVVDETCNMRNYNEIDFTTNMMQEPSYVIRQINNNEINLQQIKKQLKQVYTFYNAKFLSKIHNANILAGLNLKQLRGNDATLKEYSS